MCFSFASHGVKTLILNLSTDSSVAHAIYVFYETEFHMIVIRQVARSQVGGGEHQHLRFA